MFLQCFAYIDHLRILHIYLIRAIAYEAVRTGRGGVQA